jgi:uncharacterized protein (TIGR01777 family)
MRIAITGSHGLIGAALIPALRASGHDVIQLVRGTPGGPGQVEWDPAAGSVDLPGLSGVEAAVHLAGAGVGDKRWSDEYKRVVRDSRVLGTRTLVRALTSLDPLPAVLVSGSAIGYYGDRGDEELTESSGKGDGFLSDVVQAWEAEAVPAQEAGIRVVHPRTGLVMARSGGAFSALLLLSRFGLGGPIWNGRQWWSWITLPDTVAALQHLIESDLAGPVNLTAPAPARNIEVIRALTSALHRPALVPAPAFALRLLLGEFAGEVLASQRVLPDRLTGSGFAYQHATLPGAAEWVTKKRSTNAH